MMNSDNRDFQSELQRCQTMVQKRLKSVIKGYSNYGGLRESMRYSLIGGGKHIRAVICLKFCEASGGKLSNALDAACAIEMMHTYTLIHDDLPCMDDDDFRRGKPSNHIKFGEFTATLAGDALQAAAFETLLASKLPSADVLEMARIFAAAAGPNGVCGGQCLDMQEKKSGVEGLKVINNLKTAELISAAARIGTIAGNGAPEQRQAADNYARALGLAFQVRDDVLDEIATEQELGKPIGSDRGNDKVTFASLMGLEECERVIREETEKAISALSGRFGDAEFLIWLATTLAERKS